jgi:hypothetical protein
MFPKSTGTAPQRPFAVPGVRVVLLSLGWLAAVLVAAPATAGEKPGLRGQRVTQAEVASGALSAAELRAAGRRIFTTVFNKLDGYGDGPFDAGDGITPGGRPTLQGNGTLLRVNGLDGQSCLECHSVVSARTRPPRLGIGGVGGSVTNAIIMPTLIDPADLLDSDGAADFNGRFANPPFLFGAGGVELLALEMTADLHTLARRARAEPGESVRLVTKGVDFGGIIASDDGILDTSGVVGVDADLIVKPFGRKGEFATARAFDIEAMQFHFGMQPVEAVGAGNDADDDGVIDEILVGELSVLHAFAASATAPRVRPGGKRASAGRARFDAIGCASCHTPVLATRGSRLPLRFPQVFDDAEANVYYRVDLTDPAVGFQADRNGSIDVPLFSDLKRHDMGVALAESADFADPRRNREFITARLWGVADTAPYLHDGRATTLTEAILLHGGEAHTARDAFAALSQRRRAQLIGFLGTLRTPRKGVRE